MWMSVCDCARSFNLVAIIALPTYKSRTRTGAYAGWLLYFSLIFLNRIFNVMSNDPYSLLLNGRRIESISSELTRELNAIRVSLANFFFSSSVP